MTAAAQPHPDRLDPATDRRLATLQLRMGQLGLARAALEALAGSGDLDDDGLLALAEARWRTGDLTGAGEAAQAYLASGGEETVGVIIAAEAVAAVGRPGEARRIAERLLERSDVPLDRIFAGMPRSTLWPRDPADAGQPARSSFGAGTDARGGRERSPSEAAPRSAAGFLPGAGARVDTDHGHASVGAPGVWEADDPDDLPDAAGELAAGRLAIEDGRLAEAGVRFALVLRIAPDLAPAVLEATEPATTRTAEVEIIRGDAFRLVGHELDARRAYSAAAVALEPGSTGPVAARPGEPGAPTGDPPTDPPMEEA